MMQGTRRTALMTASALATSAVCALPAAAQTGTAATTPGAAPARPVVAHGGPVQASGNIRTFQGDIDPYGNIRTFAGDLLPNGNIRTFNGAINPYLGNIRTFAGTVNPLLGNVRDFWGKLTPAGGAQGATVAAIRDFTAGFDAASVDLVNSWQAGAAAGNYAVPADRLSALIQQGQAAWGQAVAARTGKSFRAGFVDPILARYGLSDTDATSLARLDAVQRQLFLMDWYDGLMGYSGLDQVDHWMSTVNWSPSITETIGEGRQSVIGLLDFTVTGDGTQNIVKYDGVSTFSNGHGSAVASLMVAAHDGRGVMGIAPMASVVAYNPFDASGTANWDDVKAGVRMLSNSNASIVNMSLGVPGWTLHPGWNGVFADMTMFSAKQTVFVVAAGNDGSSQTQNVVWSSFNPKLIIVGSVDPLGNISSFSNRPGTACLVAFSGSACQTGNRLMDRFMVAPGELILVSDGQGGTTRMSGTSFAAPLVSGTVALIHDRWPWLARYPTETVDILLSTARDLGAPGTDPVYGRGLLDVTAALSPISFDALRWYTYDKDGNLDREQASKIRQPSEVAKWEAKGMTFFAYEDIGASFRDFAIPASTKLQDQSAMSAGGTMERLQTYIYQRFLAWVNSPAAKGKSGGWGWGFATASSPIPNAWGLQLTMTAAPRTRAAGFRSGELPMQTGFQLSDPAGRLGVMVGEGDGAVALGGQAAFGFASDFDPYTGGANPLLGYASGGGYVQARVRLAPDWTLAASATARRLRRDFDLVPFDQRAGLSALGAYRAQAQSLALAYAPGGRVTLTGTYSRLSEGNALLGMQSTDRRDLDDGSATDGLTLGADVAFGRGLTLAASGTVARSLAGGDQNISVGGAGLVSSAFQVAMAKDGVIDRRDRLRFSVAQPLHLEAGVLDVKTVQVVDRQQGTLGTVTQRLALSGPQRQFIGEAMYGRSFLGDRAQVSLFGRFNLNGAETVVTPTVTGGAGLALRF